MSRNIWTNEQKEMLHSSMTNEEIAQATGRTMVSVKRARYYYTGHEVELESARIKKNDTDMLRYEQKARKVQREEHLRNLCKRLGVRLYG